MPCGQQGSLPPGKITRVCIQQIQKSIFLLAPTLLDLSLSLVLRFQGPCQLGGCGTSTWCWCRATDDLALLPRRGEKSQAHEQNPHRVPDLEPHARLEPRDDLIVKAGGIEGQGQLFREVTHLQLHFGADFLGEERGLNEDTAEAGQGSALEESSPAPTPQ